MPKYSFECPECQIIIDKDIYVDNFKNFDNIIKENTPFCKNGHSQCLMVKIMTAPNITIKRFTVRDYIKQNNKHKDRDWFSKQTNKLADQADEQRRLVRKNKKTKKK